MRMPKRGSTLPTSKRREIFLQMLAAGLTVERAAKAIGVTRMTCYQWRRADAQFRAEWEAPSMTRSRRWRPRLHMVCWKPADQVLVQHWSIA
jgi:transposase-like protein